MASESVAIGVVPGMLGDAGLRAFRTDNPGKSIEVASCLMDSACDVVRAVLEELPVTSQGHAWAAVWLLEAASSVLEAHMHALK